MRLEYRILWIENEKDWLKIPSRQLSKFLKDQGLEARFRFLEDGREIQGMISKTKLREFDLILVDLSLNKGYEGSNIIKLIREKDIYTEIIFYSQDAPAVRRKLQELELDGVFCSSRSWRDYLEEKVQGVILNSLRKLTGLSAIRGLVMSETGEIEQLIEEVLVFYTKNETEENIKEIEAYTYDKLKKSTVSSRNKAERIAKEKWPVRQILEETRILDFKKKTLILRKVAEKISGYEPGTLFSTIEDLNKNRNELAHCREKFEDDEYQLVTKEGIKAITGQNMKKMRKDLKSVKVSLERLLGQVRNLKGS